MAKLARGVYEHLVTEHLATQLAEIEPDLVKRVDLDATDAHEVLARHIAALTRRALRSVRGNDRTRLADQIALVNRIAATIADATHEHNTDDLVAASHDLLTAIVDRPAQAIPITFPSRPEVPLSSSELLVNGRGQPRIGSEIVREMASADHVDLLCAVIKWHGLRLIVGAVQDLIKRGGRLRVITTTYMGATDQRAIDRLIQLGAEVRVSYETRTTRLHAKAWLFRRANGTSTGYVGSSNLSKSALVDGLEWNVRLAEMDQGRLLDRFDATFEDYWNDVAFEPYEPQRDGDRLRNALAAESGSTPTTLDIDVTTIDVRPYGYQREILDELTVERELHHRMQNLVVMATGTGKTVVAALDYKRLRNAGTVESVLFVAHREEILQQSRSTFRHVLSDGTFGEFLVGGERPTHWTHVFASVQSLRQQSGLDPRQFDMVIVDEFHHAEAPSYEKLLKHLQPKILLGLTATPERADGQDITEWFGNRIAVELRLWEALERQLLAPFQYFGIHDDVDLSHIQWKRGAGYVATELADLYTGHDARARLIVQAIRDKVDPSRMRAVGFCVSIGHAQFMAAYFNRAQIPALAITSLTSREDRRDALLALRNGSIRALFTVDLFNEGVDLPAIDTILLLRPTDSATIFLQQIGRGLRLHDDKPCLTVLDFIGGQHAKFRFDRRYRALTGASRRGVEHEVEHDFPTLPAGCHVQLDEVARSIVLKNIQASLQLRSNELAAELRQLGDVPLTTFLAETGLEIEDIYRSGSLLGWTGLRRRANLAGEIEGEEDSRIASALGRLLHVDDPDRLDALAALADGKQPEGRVRDMVHVSLWGKRIDVQHTAAALADYPLRRHEIRQIAEVLRARRRRVTWRADPTSGVPIQIHARYSRNEACAAFGVADPLNVREGVKWVPEENADLFFVTLTKTEEHYSPTTMYQDRAITPSLFQWESQSTTSEASRTGQRYIHHARDGSTVHLFVRQSKETDGNLGVPPYFYAGPMTYVSHTGERPMRICWRLDVELPADIYHAARVAAG
jgi:superfamily II DNA or RNA helicase/HKD family nuclease